MRKPRLRYFDMLKKHRHIHSGDGTCTNYVRSRIGRAAIFKFIGEVHMPLFFFISGWMAMRALGEGNGVIATPSVLPRA